MASSSSEVEKGDGTMDIGHVPAALVERLGVEATGGLVQLFNEAREAVDDQREEWSEQVLNLVAERFERRLVEEASKLRVEMAQGFAAVRHDLSALELRLHKEIAASVRWSFLFWVGQVAAMTALLAFMLRGVPR
jgi:hypothetical protein